MSDQQAPQQTEPLVLQRIGKPLERLISGASEGSQHTGGGGDREDQGRE